MPVRRRGHRGCYTRMAWAQSSQLAANRMRARWLTDVCAFLEAHVSKKITDQFCCESLHNSSSQAPSLTAGKSGLQMQCPIRWATHCSVVRNLLLAPTKDVGWPGAISDILGWFWREASHNFSSSGFGSTFAEVFMLLKVCMRLGSFVIQITCSQRMNA